MGKKVHPKFIRLGNGAQYSAFWSPSFKQYRTNTKINVQINNYLESLRKKCFISNFRLETFGDSISITIYSSRSTSIIKKDGQGIELIASEVAKITDQKINISVRDCQFPESNASIIGSNIANRVEKGMSYIRTVKKSISDAMKNSKVKGIKILCSGRLSGAEMARSESYKEGSIPLSSISNSIDYSMTEAKTKYGIVCFKVWVYKKR